MDDPNRGTGRTTSLMLRALSEAIAQPGEWVEYIDHHAHDVASAAHHASNLAGLADAVGLDHMRLRTAGRRVYIASVPPTIAGRW